MMEAEEIIETRGANQKGRQKEKETKKGSNNKAVTDVVDANQTKSMTMLSTSKQNAPIKRNSLARHSGPRL